MKGLRAIMDCTTSFDPGIQPAKANCTGKNFSTIFSKLLKSLNADVSFFAILIIIENRLTPFSICNAFKKAYASMKLVGSPTTVITTWSTAAANSILEFEAPAGVSTIK